MQHCNAMLVLFLNSLFKKANIMQAKWYTTFICVFVCKICRNLPLETAQFFFFYYLLAICLNTSHYQKEYFFLLLPSIAILTRNKIFSKQLEIHPETMSIRLPVLNLVRPRKICICKQHATRSDCICRGNEIRVSSVCQPGYLVRMTYT